MSQDLVKAVQAGKMTLNEALEIQIRRETSDNDIHREANRTGMAMKRSYRSPFQPKN